MRSWGLRAVVAGLVVLLTGMPVGADFHLAVIDEFMSGCGNDPTMQYVEIRMLQNGQNVVGGSKLTAFSCDGTTVKQLELVGSNITNATMGGRWIMASPSFQAASGIAPDFAMLDANPGIFPDCGQICWGKPSAGSEDSPGAYVDCVAYGAYSGAVSHPPVASTPNTGAQSLTRAGGAAFDNNFALAAPSPTNSMNQVGNLSACTPVPSTTTSTAVGTTSTTSPGGGATTSTTTSGGGSTTSTTVGPALLGGGSTKTDCFAEWRVEGATATAPVVRCTDNDTTCDGNPAAGCLVRAQLCFYDPTASIYAGSCAASPVTTFALTGKPDAQNAAAVAAAVAQLPGAQPSLGGVTFTPALIALTCTGPIDLEVPLKVKNDKPKKGARVLKSVTTAGKRDKDKLKVLCLP